jgi:hypothetical protein
MLPFFGETMRATQDRSARLNFDSGGPVSAAPADLQRCRRSITKLIVD